MLSPTTRRIRSQMQTAIHNERERMKEKERDCERECEILTEREREK